MENNKNSLKKEQIISLWTRKCKELKKESSFLLEGSDSSPYYLLILKDGISIYVSAQEKQSKSYKYSVGVIFGEYVNYKEFEMDLSEFNSLASIFMDSREKVRNEMVKDIVNSKEKEFYELIKE
jgi:hypothetical protein